MATNMHSSEHERGNEGGGGVKKVANLGIKLGIK